jgi:hypothetical protein
VCDWLLLLLLQVSSFLRQVVREQQEMLRYIVYCHLLAAVMSVDLLQNNF